MNNKKIIFLKYSLLEELEMSNKGNVSAEQVLTLVNKKKYKLEEAVIFKEVLEGTPSNPLLNRIMTIADLAKNGYDFYMGTVIIEDCVYRVDEGFKGILIDDIPHEEFKKKEKTSEELLADLMLGL